MSPLFKNVLILGPTTQPGPRSNRHTRPCSQYTQVTLGAFALEVICICLFVRTVHSCRAPCGRQCCR
ncbi:Hypothetical protein SMAX5B_018284 [Scophthalmus maximus]|uniref:Uncharacterized protein n=1 Tax=Scophthalmus maximus TaxID=52904 RepID=A0A2U9CDN5_SCOMX|nr:Hypothetical protein SMAX5B_018284 [Scophthalmus maximus]